MKKDGFTLIELLGTILIIMLITVMAFYSIMEVNDETRSKTYDAKIKLIKSAAKEWGNDNLNDLSNTCTYVYVRDLIAENYMTGDNENKTVLKNPITNNSMNGMKVCVKYVQENDIYKIKTEVDE